jgi:RNA polymerase sigma-70 factor (ECF subfamily)
MTLEAENYAEIFTKEIMDIITDSLSRLPEQTRYIFIQTRFKYKSRKEIAAELNVSLQKVDYHINKANDHLYKYLKDYFPLLLLLLHIHCPH